MKGINMSTYTKLYVQSIAYCVITSDIHLQFDNIDYKLFSFMLLLNSKYKLYFHILFYLCFSNNKI